MWISIILALISFFTSKKSGASNSEALTNAALVGGGTYYVATQTAWGQKNLGLFDTPAGTGTGGTPVLDKSGQAVIDPATGLPMVSYANTQSGTGAADVLKSWGGTGTAAVIGTAAVATNGDLMSSISKYLPIIIGAVAVVALTR